MSAKNAVIKAKIENELVELMTKTVAENVYLSDGTSVASKLADVIASLNGKQTAEQVNAAVSAAISSLINGAPETYDTLKEISDYISAHADAVTSLNSAIGNKVDKVSGKGLSANDFTTALKNKLDGIAANAEVNQNAYSTVKVGTTSVSAGSKTATLELAAGNNVTLTPDASNGKITIAAKDTTYSDATQSAHGLMTAADKTKLDGIATGANKTTVDSAMSSTSSNPVQNKVAKAYVDALPNVFVAASQPSSMKNGDVWIGILS